MPEQHLGEEAVLERNLAVVPGVAGGELGDRGHAVAVMVAPGHDARPARRAQRGRVHVGVAQPVRRERVEVRRRDRAAVAAQLPEADVVEHDHQDVGRAGGRTGFVWPPWLGLPVIPADAALEGSRFHGVRRPLE